MEMQLVGKIVAVTGNAFIEHNGESHPLEVGSPVYKGAILVTGSDAHVEVRFNDDTMLSQSANSKVSIDNFVFNDPGDSPSILLNLTEGALRTITGKIAEENPENFEVKSPLATLGIRGTDFILSSSPSAGDRIVLNQISDNHILIVRDENGNIRYLNDPGAYVAVKIDSPISSVGFFTPEQIEKLLQDTPFTSLPNNGISGEEQSLLDGSSGSNATSNDTENSDEAGSGGAAGDDDIDASALVSDALGYSAPGTPMLEGIDPISPEDSELAENLSPGGIYDSAESGTTAYDALGYNSLGTYLLDGLDPIPLEDSDSLGNLFSSGLFSSFEVWTIENDPLSVTSLSSLTTSTSYLYFPTSSTFISLDDPYGESTIYLETAQIYDDTPPEPDYLLVPTGTSSLLSQSFSQPTAQQQETQPSSASTPEPTVADSTVTVVPPPASLDQILLGTAGSDIITGGAGNDILVGYGGSDQLFGQDGDDSFVIWGTFGATVYSGTDIAGNSLPGGNTTPHLPDSVIEGGAGYDTLISYGTANYSGVSINSIEAIEITPM